MIEKTGSQVSETSASHPISWAPLCTCDQTNTNSTALQQLESGIQPCQSRIQQLVSQHLQRRADTDGGWRVLYRDPEDGRFWEFIYPHSDMHGIGPTRLAVISKTAAAQKYDAI
jgi:hypothetical protein